MTYAIGNLTVYGAHEDDPGGLSVRLTPHSHHAAYGWFSESTRAVLKAMEDLSIEGAKVLDLGCGASAILAIAAAKMGAASVVACEINPEMAAIAGRQIEANGLMIPVVASEKGKYDVIVANIGDAVLVGELSKRSKRGVGTAQDGELLPWS